MSMPSNIQAMLDKRPCRNDVERRAALKEVIQEIALIGLGRGNFFSKAAFYGGTALRIFHGLDRFSEDLDFSLVEPDSGFNLGRYLPFVRDELGAWGFEIEVEVKAKIPSATIQSAFIKGGTLIHLIKITSVQPPVPGVPINEMLKVKLEIDIDPPSDAGFEVKYGLLPQPYAVRLYDLPSLFAGKISAILCRSWRDRIKGRDYYDYLWFLGRGVAPNLYHLEARLRQIKAWTDERPIGKKELLDMLEAKFSTVDFSLARADVAPFIQDSRVTQLWSKDFFISISREKL